MHNKKLIATTLLLTATLAASLTACGNKTATKAPEPEVKTETTKSPVELDTEAATKKEEVTTEAVTEAPTEDVTEAQTEAVVEEVTEAPAEAPVEVVEQPVVEAPEPVVVETPAPAPSPSTNKNTNTNTASNNQTGKITNATSSKVTVNADGTVSSPSGTYSSIDAYNEGTGHTDPDDPEHLMKAGYLKGDDEARRKRDEELIAKYKAQNGIK